MRILFLSAGTTVPASRFRVGQFLEHFERAGIECTHHFAYGDSYNAVHRTSVGSIYKLAGKLRRALFTLSAGRYDVVFLQRTTFNATAWPERIAHLLHARVVYDFDDALFLDSHGRPSVLHRRTFQWMVKRSVHVIAGNEYLAHEAAAPGKTTVIPTVIDTDRYTPASSRAPGDHTVIGWMGTASNLWHLPLVEPAIRAILAEFPTVSFRVVSNGKYRPLLDHPRVEQVSWNAEREIPDLRTFDVGIMPLHDTAWTRGKCAFKLIQYMSVGRPVVASPVGANVDLVLDSNAGFLAASTEDWVRYLRMLVRDAKLRETMGAAARVRIVERYSVASVLPTYLRILETAAKSPVRGSEMVEREESTAERAGPRLGASAGVPVKDRIGRP